MSGAVEGVDRARKLLHESYDSACVETKVWYSEDTVIEAMLEFAARTTPPARSYADGVRDAADLALADSRMYADPEVAGSVYQLSAAIRLLSQGGKA